MLVVQEKRGIFHGIGVWKLPTGIVDPVCLFFKDQTHLISNEKIYNLVRNVKLGFVPAG